MTNPKKILVLGLGNVLMRDEGAGIEVINWLEKEILPSDVELVDGGTGGFHLLGMFTGYERVILIDAALTNDEAGVVKLIRPRFASDFPRVLSTHDIGLRDLIESAYLLEKVPEIWLVTISVKDFQDMGIGLSESIQAAVPNAGKQVLKLLEKE